MKEILAALEGLNKDDFDIHLLNDAWYSQKALTRAVSNISAEELEKIPAVTCVRIGLAKGMLELHPQDGKVQVWCYCCFGGDPDKGLIDLVDLKSLIISLKDHYCPPFPG